MRSARLHLSKQVLSMVMRNGSSLRICVLSQFRGSHNSSATLTTFFSFSA